MTRWEAFSFYVAAFVVSVTGIAYLFMKYFLENEDPFALVNHPWQQPMLKIHILAAPVLILAVGSILKSHFLQKLRLRENGNRLTGVALLSLFPIMTLSGYALQVESNPLVLKVALILHIGTGTVFAAACLAHMVTGFKLAKKKAQTWSGRNKRRIAA